MDILGIIILAVCLVTIVKIVQLGVWARKNPAPVDAESDEELEWMNDIK